MVGRKASLTAICPNTVALPVCTTRTRAVPLLTLVPASVFQQLKNAGGLRLISNIEVIKKIQAYENNVEEMDELQKLTEDLLMNYRQQMAMIFDGRVFKNMVINGQSRNIEARFSRPTGNPPLFNDSPEALNDLLNKTLYVHNNNLGIASRSKELKRAAIELDNMLIKTYHLN